MSELTFRHIGALWIAAPVLLIAALWHEGVVASR